MKKLFLALMLLAVPATAQTLPNVNLVFEPFHANGIYKIGERAGWTIRAALGAGYTRYNYELRENNLTVLKSGVIVWFSITLTDIKMPNESASPKFDEM